MYLTNCVSQLTSLGFIFSTPSRFVLRPSSWVKILQIYMCLKKKYVQSIQGHIDEVKQSWSVISPLVLPTYFEINDQS